MKLGAMMDGNSIICEKDSIVSTSNQVIALYYFVLYLNDVLDQEKNWHYVVSKEYIFMEM